MQGQDPVRAGDIAEKKTKHIELRHCAGLCRRNSETVCFTVHSECFFCFNHRIMLPNGFCPGWPKALF